MLAKRPFDTIRILENPEVQLALSLMFDAIGMATYLVPLIGEFGDILWAPIQAAYIYGMVGRSKLGVSLAAVGFAEEILPLTDFVPSCSITWFIVYVQDYVRR